MTVLSPFTSRQWRPLLWFEGALVSSRQRAGKSGDQKFDSYREVCYNSNCRFAEASVSDVFVTPSGSPA